MKPHLFTSSHMHTLVNISVYSNEDRSSLEPYAQAAFQIFVELEQQFSLFLPSSELSQFNQHSGEVVHVSQVLLETSTFAQTLAQYTGWAFNSLRGNLEWPGHIGIDQTASTLQIPAGTILDLNAVVKGMAIDQALKVFPTHWPVLLEAGGDLKVQGSPPGNRAWNIGIRHLNHPTELAASFPLITGAMCTSGLYFRGPHLTNSFRPLNPKMSSVTVTGPTAKQADAISTALFFFEIEQALAFINAKSELAACIIDREGHTHLSRTAYQLLTTAPV